MVHCNKPALQQPVKPDSTRSVLFTPDRFFFDCSFVKVSDMLRADFTGKNLRLIQRKRRVGLCWEKIQKITDS